MSGKDERRVFDIPVCPICGERPKFWTLQENKDIHSPIVGWLLSNDYLENNTSYSKRLVITRRNASLNSHEFLEKIKGVGHYAQWETNIFEQGNDIFAKIISAAKYLWNTGNHHVR